MSASACMPSGGVVRTRGQVERAVKDQDLCQRYRDAFKAANGRETACFCPRPGWFETFAGRHSRKQLLEMISALEDRVASGARPSPAPIQSWARRQGRKPTLRAVKPDVEEIDPFIHGMVAALGCLWLGFGDGPGTARYDEILLAAGEDQVLRAVRLMHADDVALAGLTEWLKARTEPAKEANDGR